MEQDINAKIQFVCPSIHAACDSCWLVLIVSKHLCYMSLRTMTQAKRTSRRPQSTRGKTMKCSKQSKKAVFTDHV